MRAHLPIRCLVCSFVLRVVDALVRHDLDGGEPKIAELALVQLQASYSQAQALRFNDPVKAFDNKRNATLSRRGSLDSDAAFGSRIRLLRTIGLSRSLSFAILAIGIVSMLLPRGLQYFFKHPSVNFAIFVIDTLVWYFATVVYLTTSQEIARSSHSDMVLGVTCFVQVFAGSALLPLAEAKPQGSASLSSLLPLFACAACAFFYGSYFSLDALAHGGILLVSNVRALEPLSTTFLMVMFGGQSLNPTQYVAMIAAILGVGLSTNDASSFAEQFGAGAGTSILVIVLANFCFSLRNVILHHARDLIVGSKITLFVACCALAPIPASSNLGLLFLIKNDRLDNFMKSHVDLLAISVTSFVLYNVASFLILMRTTPTTHAMLLCGKRIVTVLLACLIVRQWPSFMQIAGLSVTALSVQMFESGKSENKNQSGSESRLGTSQIPETTPFQELVSSPKALAVCTLSLCVVCPCVAMYVA